MKKRDYAVYIVAVISGVFLSLSYVNPYGGKILLSELILQMSGSNGEFVLNISALNDWVRFALRLLPSCIMEVFLGVSLYRYFCIASIYVFSRCEDRRKWYWHEMLSMGKSVIFFQMIVMAVTIITAALRHQIRIDSPGVILLIYHLVLYTLWSYSMVILINLVALRFGSSEAFVIVMIIQIVGSVLLAAWAMLKNSPETGDKISGIILRINPISRLILGWQKSIIPEVDSIQTSAYEHFYLEESLLVLVFINIIILIIGEVMVKRHDLLVSDSEIGVI